MVWSQIIAAFLVIVDIIGLPGNLLVILTIFLEERFHVFRYILLASLAASDFMFLILVNSFRIASIVEQRWLYGDTMCHLNPFFARYFYINTVAHLISVSYDRHRAIVKSPLTYHGTMTRSKVLSVFLIWIIPIPFAIGPFLGYGSPFVYNPEVFFCEDAREARDVYSSSRLAFFMFIGFILPFAVIICLNWSVYKKAKHQAKAIGSLMENRAHSQQLQPPRQRIELRAAVDVGIIIAAFLLCFLPGWAVTICRQFIGSVKVPSEVVLVTSCIFIANSLCNPIIYSVRKRHFRTGVKQVLRRIGIRGRSNIIYGQHVGRNNLSIVANVARDGFMVRYSEETNCGPCSITIPSSQNTTEMNTLSVLNPPFQNPA